MPAGGLQGAVHRTLLLCRTFFNAVTDSANAKTGNYPFTTIDPNRSISYYKSPCPCADSGRQCTPQNGGHCAQGVRHTPFELLDVAGLIPGASGGAGLGNKFLNDLCGARALIHVIDASGRTNEKGEVTEGHDPAGDVLWLHQEIQDWIFGNVHGKWDSMVRRHTARCAHNSGSSVPTVAESLNSLFSGYGSRESTMATALQVARLPQNADIAAWDETSVRRFVAVFQALRFPTLLFLNKADAPAGGATDRNISKLCKKFGSSVCYIGSAAVECFVRKAAKEGLLDYPSPGGAFQLTAAGLADAAVAGKVHRAEERLVGRFGGTGVWEVVQAAVDMTKPVMVFPVTHFGTAGQGAAASGSSTSAAVTSPATGADTAPGAVGGVAGGVAAPASEAAGTGEHGSKLHFPTVFMLQDGCNVRDVARYISSEAAAGLTHAEGPDGRSISAFTRLEHAGGRPVVLRLHISKAKADAWLAENPRAAAAAAVSK